MTSINENQLKEEEDSDWVDKMKPIKYDSEEEINVKTLPDAGYQSTKGFTNTSVSQLLAAYGDNVGQKLSVEFEKNDINYNNLSSLCNEDLTLFGVESNILREEMISDFVQMPNQIEHFESKMKIMDPNVFIENTLKNLSTHINDIKISLGVAQINLELHSPENVLVNHETYTSELLLKALNEINSYALGMEDQLNEILKLQVNKLNFNSLNIKKKRSKFWNIIIGITTLSISGFLIYKFAGKKLIAMK